MSEGVIKMVMGAAVLAGLWLLVRMVREARAAGDFDASSALILAMGGLVSLPSAAVAASGGLLRETDAFGQLTASFPSWYLDVTRLAALLVAGVALAVLLRGVVARSFVSGAALFAVALWGVAWLGSGLAGGTLYSLSGVALLVCLGAAALSPRGRGAPLGVGIVALGLATTSAALALVNFDVAFVPCLEKCSIEGPLLAGIFANENTLGLVLAAAIPLSYLGCRGSTGVWVVAYLAGMTVATGSRTAIIAALVAVLALAVVRPRLDRNRHDRLLVAVTVLLATVLSGAYLMRHDWSLPTALTNRPALWHIASQYIAASPWIGHGPQAWARLSLSSEIPLAAEYSPHNQWLDVLFVAGSVGALLFVAVLASVVWSARHARPGVMLAIATVIVIGTTERPWAIGTLDWLSFSFVAILLTGADAEAGTGAGAGACEGDMRRRTALLRRGLQSAAPRP